MRAQDATAIGTIGIIMGWWNAFNGPFVARWADSGALNRRVPCFASWGRRAPWLLLGAPLLMAGTVLMWLPPAFDDVTLLVWYTMCYFLVINGGTATLQAYLSGIQELYGTGRLRARAIANQQPFVITTFILVAVGLPLIAFTQDSVPDNGSCCLAPSHPDCGSPPPCSCYANASAEFTASAANLSSFYAPAYAEACSAHLADLAATGAAGAAGAAGARDTACAGIGEGRGHRGRFGAAAAVLGVIGLFALLAVRPLRRTRRTAPARDTDAAPLGSCQVS